MNGTCTSATLSTRWRLTATGPGELSAPEGLANRSWIPAVVPGTAAGALRAAGRPAAGDGAELDGQDWWFHCDFDASSVGEGEQLVLALDGLATVAEVYLNGALLGRSDSMFTAQRYDITGAVREHNELAICCRALAPLLAGRRRPRARWRTRLVAEGNLRFFRTMLLGRMPGSAPGPPVVGPWREVRLLRQAEVVLEPDARLRTRIEGEDGLLRTEVRLRSLTAQGGPRSVTLLLTGGDGELAQELEVNALDGGVVAAAGELRVPRVRRWWPHTHGTPALYRARLRLVLDDNQYDLDLGNLGFRSLELGGELERDGLALRINGVAVFARGAVWTPGDLAAPHAPVAELRRILETAVDCGLNMVRVPGTACYERPEFYELCDELGILVWQDFMFANFDYPEADEQFVRTVEQEVREVLTGLGQRPSLAVLCGSSEIAQQVAMLGLDPALAESPLFVRLIPELCRQAGVDVPYVPSSPWGGALPFRPDAGVSHYFGVGAYLRPLQDARLAEVRFASECLALSNVPDEEALVPLGPGAHAPGHAPEWKRGVPRDAGAGWDFEDVRDHYLRLLYDVDPVVQRSNDAERYLELSRAVSGEVMAEVFGEWRRAGSPCSGGLVLWLRDLMPGAGWGLLDHRGNPKVVWSHLRRILAPVAVWTTDEGLGGVDIHMANDTADSVEAVLRVALYARGRDLVEEGSRPVRLEPRSSQRTNVEELLGRFVDVTWAYRFGPPAQDLVVVSLEQGDHVLSQTFRYPVGPPLRPVRAGELDLRSSLSGELPSPTLSLRSGVALYGARLHLPGFRGDDDAFSLEPGRTKHIRLTWIGEGEPALGGTISALNLAGRFPVAAEPAR